MKKTMAFQTNSLSESIIAFNQYLRENAFNIGVEETMLSLEISKFMMTSKQNFKNSLKLVVCKDPEETKIYDKLFIQFWDSNPTDLREKKNQLKVVGKVEKKTNSTLVMLGESKEQKEEINESKTVSGTNKTERLKTTDFSKISEIEHHELNKIAEQFFKEIVLKIKSRRKEKSKKGLIHINKTIRKSLSTGGTPIKLYKREKKTKKGRVIMFLDISGSMDKYSFFLLKFMIILKQFLKNIEFFLFSTSLIRVTKILNCSNIGNVLDGLKTNAKFWSSGTKMGECLTTFNDKFGKRYLNGSPTVIILSDGLDTSDPEILKEELKKIKSKSKKIVWFNPLKGSEDYSPETRSMKTALPFIDLFTSAHNLKSLSSLENILISA